MVAPTIVDLKSVQQTRICIAQENRSEEIQVKNRQDLTLTVFVLFTTDFSVNKLDGTLSLASHSLLCI